MYVKTGTRWETATEAARLTASDGEGGDQLGYTVAFDGDTIVVGALGDDHFRGSVYVFQAPPGGWVDGTETARLTPSDGVAMSYFGNSVDIDGETILVGAQYGEATRGAAYVFEASAGGWVDGVETAKLTASDGARMDLFGIHVALDADTAVVGAFRDGALRGSAYVFVAPRTGWATARETAKLTASDGAGGDQFGFSVDIEGDTAVIGAWRDDRQGSAYIFMQSPEGWETGTESAKLTASDGGAYDQLGMCVGIEGDTVILGAWGDDNARGSVYVFDRPTGGWTDATEDHRLVASDRAPDDHFGTSVRIDGGTVVVGAYGDDGGRGGAYVFE